jgi:anti-sigma factor RsiW
MSDLRCDRVVELVTDFLDGALDATTEQDVVEHLSGCDGCQDYVAQFQRTVSELGGLPPAALSPQARAELLEKFRQGA